MRSHEIHKRRWAVAEYGDSFYFEQMKKMADAINDLEEEAWRQMEEKLILYRQKMAEYKVCDQALTRPKISYPYLLGAALFALSVGLLFYYVKRIVYFVLNRLYH